MLRFFSLSLFAMICTTAQAQAVPASQPPVFIHVDAPYAQRIVVQVKALHKEIAKLGLHAVPPGDTRNAIIASDNPQKIGKLSSPPDMEKLATGKPVAVRVEKDKIFDLLLPITDEHGGNVDGGFVVMEVPFTEATDEAQALAIGVAIRDELQKLIPNEEALYKR